MAVDEQTGLRLQDGEEVLLRMNPLSWQSGLMLPTLGLWYFWAKATWYVVTDRRLITKKGILNKTEISLPLHFVQDASVHISVGGAARVTVSTAGGGAGISQMMALAKGDAPKLADTIMSQAMKQRRPESMG